jgi:hypothetical protein
MARSRAPWTHPRPDARRSTLRRQDGCSVFCTETPCLLGTLLPRTACAARQPREARSGPALQQLYFAFVAPTATCAIPPISKLRLLPYAERAVSPLGPLSLHDPDQHPRLPVLAPNRHSNRTRMGHGVPPAQSILSILSILSTLIRVVTFARPRCPRNHSTPILQVLRSTGSGHSSSESKPCAKLCRELTKAWLASR